MAYDQPLTEEQQAAKYPNSDLARAIAAEKAATAPKPGTTAPKPSTTVPVMGSGLPSALPVIPKGPEISTTLAPFGQGRTMNFAGAGATPRFAGSAQSTQQSTQPGFAGPKPDTFASDREKAKLQEIDAKKWNPEGKSFLQKFGHGLATAGNIAGDIFAPQTMALIPGTQLHSAIEERRAENAYEKARAQEEKPELAAAQGELKGRIETQKEGAAAQRQEEHDQTQLAETDKRIDAAEQGRKESEAAAASAATQREADTDKRQANQFSEEEKLLSRREASQGARLAKTEADKDSRAMGYYMDDKGNTVYGSKGDADKIHSTFETITPADVNKDRQAVRQLNDVQKNTSAYRKSIDAIPSNISALAASNMEAIASDKTIGPKLEAFGLGLDTGMVNDVLKGTSKASAWNHLSPQEQDAMIGYLRAKGSVLAYQKALTGVGRTNKEQMEIEMENLPAPWVGAKVADKQMDAWQQNIDRATEGFPSNLPGIKSPKQVREETEGKQGGSGNLKQVAPNHYVEE